jgi:signal peptidase II
MNQTTRLRALLFSISALALIADRISKYIIVRELPLHSSRTVIKGMFYITHVLNPGAAFSLFADLQSAWTKPALVIFTLIVLAVVAFALLRARKMTTGNLGLALIFGGAIGNLIDRISTGLVVDFLAVYIGSYHWPDFNLADSAIVCGAILLIAEVLFPPEKKAAEAQRA